MSQTSPSARRHRALKFLGHLWQYKTYGPLIGPKEAHQPEWRWARPRRLACDRFGSYIVSTVWLGIDQSEGKSAQPVTFETMVFHERTGLEDRWMNRYSTEAEALAGHEEILTVIRATDGLG